MAFNKQLNGSYRNCYHSDKNKNSWQCGKDNELIDKDKNEALSLPITFPSVLPSLMKNILAKADSGALRYYFKKIGQRHFNKHEISDKSSCKSTKQWSHYFLFQGSNISVFSAIQKGTICTCVQIYPQWISHILRTVILFWVCFYST